MAEAEFLKHLQDKADALGMEEPKRSTWIRYGGNVDTRRSLLAQLRGAAALDPAWNVLDIGCGYGNLLKACEGEFAHLAGIEIEADRVEWAQKRVPGADIRVGSATELPWAEGTFDFALSTDVFEHINHDWQRTSAREVARVLKPGGYFYYAVPNRFQIWDEHNKVFFGTWPRGQARERWVRLMGKKAFTEVWELTRQGWRALFEEVGFEEVSSIRDLNEGGLKRAVGVLFPQRTSLLLRKRS